MVGKKFLYFGVVFCLSMVLPGAGWVNKAVIVLENAKGTSIMLPKSFLVANGKVILIDEKSANVKTFDLNGKHISTFGKKGVGPNEFVSPKYSALNGNTFIIRDEKARNMLVYHGMEQKPVLYKKYLDVKHANNIKFLDKKTLLMSGYIYDKGEFCSLMTYDLSQGQYRDVLVYFKEWIGVDSKIDIMNKIITGEIISVDGFADFNDQYIFFCSASVLKIIRIDRSSAMKKVFGKRSDRFVPFLGDKRKLLQLGNDQDETSYNEYRELIQRVSFVYDIVVMPNSQVGLIFSSFNKNRKALDLYIQSYNLDGSFVDEHLLLQAKADNFETLALFYDKEKNTYWILDTDESDDSGTVVCRLYRFETSDG